MHTTITFSGNSISFVTLDGRGHTLKPFYYRYQDSFMIGRAAERAIDLYPDYVYNVFEQDDSGHIQDFLRVLREKLVRTYRIKEYELVFESGLERLAEEAAACIPETKIRLFEPSSELLPRHASKNEIKEAFAVVIANFFARDYSLPSPLYLRLKKMMRLRVNEYIRELLAGGKARIHAKLVEQDSSVRVIRTLLRRGTLPHLDALLALCDGEPVTEARLAQALYGIYDDNYKVTLISPFSHGKSTLINGLIGEKLLGMDVRAETAIITKLVSASDNSLFVKFEGDRMVRHAYRTMEELTGMLEDLTSVRSGQTPLEVQIRYRSDSFPGTTIIDAPGLNSRHGGHNEIAYKAFGMADLILFLINPAKVGEEIFTKQIKELLALKQGSDKRHAYVLSMLDYYYDKSDIVMKELHTVLQTLDPSCGDDRVFFVSGFFALYGKLLMERKIPLEKVRKTEEIYVLEDDDLLSGRLIEQHHARTLIEFSRIERLAQYIRNRGESADSNEFDLDRRDPEAI